MELIQGKSYKIKRVKKYFNGEHNKNGSWKKKQKTIWIDGVYIGSNGSYCTFDIGNGKEIDIPKDDIETKIKDHE